MMKCAVIVPSYQSAGTIGACLASLVAQDIAHPFDIVVADSGTDGTREIVSRDFSTVRLLASDTRLDPAQARNLGAQHAHADVLAFIDSDCTAPRDWVRRLSASIEDGYDGVGGAIGNGRDANAVSWAGYFCEFREFLPGDAAVDATNLTLGNAAYRAETFRRIGGFPAGYFPQEDQIFHERVRAAGGRLRFDASIVVTHEHRDRVASFLRHQKRIGMANARVVRTLHITGAAIASRRWLATALVPALAAYRFARTLSRCWRQERAMMLRRPAVAGLCWLGMLAWAIGFANGAGAVSPSAEHVATQYGHADR